MQKFQLQYKVQCKIIWERKEFSFLMKVIQLTLSLSQVSLACSAVLPYKHQDVCAQGARSGPLVGHTGRQLSMPHHGSWILLR